MPSRRVASIHLLQDSATRSKGRPAARSRIAYPSPAEVLISHVIPRSSITRRASNWPGLRVAGMRSKMPRTLTLSPQRGTSPVVVTVIFTSVFRIRSRISRLSVLRSMRMRFLPRRRGGDAMSPMAVTCRSGVSAHSASKADGASRDCQTWSTPNAPASERRSHAVLRFQSQTPMAIAAIQIKTSDPICVHEAETIPSVAANNNPEKGQRRNHNGDSPTMALETYYRSE